MGRRGDGGAPERVAGAEAGALFDEAWDTAAAGNPHCTVFQSAGWYRSWLSTEAGARAAPLVLRARAAGGRAVALALQLDERSRSVTPLSWPWADYHELVGPLDERAAGALALALRRLVDEGFRVVLDDVVPGGGLASVAVRAGFARRAANRTAAIDLCDAEAVARIVRRAEHETKVRRLGRRGELRLSHRTTPESRRTALERMVAMHDSRGELPQDRGLFDPSVRRALLKAVAAEDSTSCPLVVSELTLDGRLLASYAGFVRGHWYGGYWTTFDGAYRRWSPGQLLLRAMVADFSAGGMQTIDLLRGDEPYKARFASTACLNARFDFGLRP